MADQADHIFNADAWEATYDGSDFYLLTEDMEPGQIMEVGRLNRLPPTFAAMVPISWDDGEPDDWEVREFPTRAEAQAAVAVKATKP